jgi:amidophosphoribosyltransferase
MCGIAGLFSKSGSIEESLGAHLSAMLTQLADRGPDSAGVALYRDPAPAGSCKVSLFSPDETPPWNAIARELDQVFGAEAEPEVRASHALSSSRSPRSPASAIRRRDGRSFCLLRVSWLPPRAPPAASWRIPC